MGMDGDRSNKLVNLAQAYNTVRKEICKLCGFNYENSDELEEIAALDAEGGRKRDGDGRQK